MGATRYTVRLYQRSRMVRAGRANLDSRDDDMLRATLLIAVSSSPTSTRIADHRRGAIQVFASGPHKPPANSATRPDSPMQKLESLTIRN